MPIPKSPWRKKTKSRKKKDIQKSEKNKRHEEEFKPLQPIKPSETKPRDSEIDTTFDTEIIEYEDTRPAQPQIDHVGPVEQIRTLGRQCPKCGSLNAQKISVYEDQKKVSGVGCIGCVPLLLLIIIFILAPMLIIGPAVVGTALGIAAIVKYWPYIVGFLGFVLLIKIISAIVKSNQYICLQCGKKFHS